MRACTLSLFALSGCASLCSAFVPAGTGSIVQRATSQSVAQCRPLRVREQTPAVLHATSAMSVDEVVDLVNREFQVSHCFSCSVSRVWHQQAQALQLHLAVLWRTAA